MDMACIAGLRPDAAGGDMRACEDLKAGDTMEFAPLAITTADIKSFAARFDPQPVHLDEAASQDTIEDGLTASGLHIVCRHLLQKTDGILRDSTSMGSPRVDAIRYLPPVRPRDSLTS